MKPLLVCALATLITLLFVNVNAQESNGQQVADLPEGPAEAIYSQLSKNDLKNLNEVSKDTRQGLLDAGLNKPTPKYQKDFRIDRNKELAELRKQMKDRGLGLKDSTRHAKSLRRSTHEEYKQNLENDSNQVARVGVDSSLENSQIDALTRKAQKNPGKPQRAAFNSIRHGTKGRAMIEVTADPKSNANHLISHVNGAKTPDGYNLNQITAGMGQRPVYTTRRQKTKSTKGNFLDDIKRLRKPQGRVIESNGKATRKPNGRGRKRCVRDKLGKILRCFSP